MAAFLLASACAFSPHAPPSTAWALRTGRPAAARMSNAPDERGSTPAMLERRLPYNQQAVVQLKEIQEGVFYDWAALPQPTLLLRLGVVYAFAAALGGWIATQTYEFPEEALQVVLAANMGGAFSLLVFFLRIYSGWSYVSDRLGMEVLDYEESGWADGFMSKKPEEIRARDQFLNEFTVKPVLKKLRPLLAAIAVSTVLSVGAYKMVEGTPDMQFAPAYLSNLQLDDKAAAAEAARAEKTGKPAYCYDRYYKAMAGGGMCD
mmetsp:Transcript_33701/g.83981  ORF Transcript_33701/g.83981 Transcript_33701/m.83981 type:complete len:262 (-) Transcript_33701:188-973(-)